MAARPGGTHALVMSSSSDPVVVPVAGARLTSARAQEGVLGTRSLRIALVLLGLVGIYIGLDVTLGGLATLGWLGATDFFRITDREMFLVQDSHQRFFGGVMLSMGALFILSATKIPRFHAALKFVLVAIFAGGLARFTQMKPAVTLGPHLLGPLAIELVLAPLLYLWLSRVVNGTRS